MAVNFYLNSRGDKHGDFPIRVSIAIGGIRLLTSVGYSINPAKWDSSKQKVRQGASNAKGITYNVINSHLNNIVQQSIDFENKCLTEKLKVTKELIQQNISTNKNKLDEVGEIREKTLFDVFDEFIKEIGNINGWTHGTYEKYIALRNHLYIFSPNLSFDDLTEKGLADFITHLRDEKGLRNSTIGKQLGFLKWFLKWSANNGYHKNMAYLSFKPKLKTTEKRIIFLTWDELMTVYNFSIPESKKYLDRVRDVFCFCCFTSLRYSDVYNLKRFDIKNGALHITTVKTADSLTIDLNKYSQAILDKYDGVPFEDNKALPVISNQKMNDYIIFKNLDGKYLTLKDCLEANKEKGHENQVFYVTDEKEQSQYINMFKEAGLDAVILPNAIDSPFISHLEQKNEKVKFLRIDADVNETFKEKEEDDEAAKEQAKKDAESLSEIFKKALGNDKLEVKVEKLKNESVASMITVSEESRRMADMMKMYSMYGGGADMFPVSETLVLNANNQLVKFVLNHKDGENTGKICQQLYDLAKLAHGSLSPERMTKFIARSGEIMMDMAREEQ